MKKIVSLILVLALALSLSAAAFAADESFSFRLSNTGTRYNTDTSNSNEKLFLNDPGTIKCAYTNTPTSGYGFSLRLVSRSIWSWKTATDTYWYTSGRELNPAYLSGQAEVNEDYYVAGRIDNDYDGTYVASGTFNADLT